MKDEPLVQHPASKGPMSSRENQYPPTPSSSSEELRQSESKLRAIIDTIPVIVWCASPDGSGEFWNRRWHDYTGLSLEDARGWGWRAAIHSDDLEELERKLRACVAWGNPVEVEARLRRFDGTCRWFLFRCEPLRDETGRIVNWYGTSTDIDDLKRAEQKLREDEQEFRRITDAIPQSIVVLSPDGTALYANRVALQDCGGLRLEANARGFSEPSCEALFPCRGLFFSVSHPDDVASLKSKREAGLLRGEPFELEMRALRPGGHISGACFSTTRFGTITAGSSAGMRRQPTSKIKRTSKEGYGTKIWLYARKSTSPRCLKKLSVLPNRCERS